MTPIRGIRFAGLGGAGPPGLALTPAGALAAVEGAAAVRQSLMLLLATLPGERVMRPDYGCPLHRIVFLPNDATTAGLAIHYVRSAVMRFEPRAEIVRLDAGPEAPNVLRIDLEYRVRATLDRDRLSLSVDLGGGA
jgi:phage baseplate assembly protein W